MKCLILAALLAMASAFHLQHLQRQAPGPKASDQVAGPTERDQPRGPTKFDQAPGPTERDQAPGPSVFQQPGGPNQVDDPAPGIYATLVADSPPSHDASLHTENARRQHEVNHKALYYGAGIGTAPFYGVPGTSVRGQHNSGPYYGGPHGYGHNDVYNQRGFDYGHHGSYNYDAYNNRAYHHQDYNGVHDHDFYNHAFHGYHGPY